MKKLLCAWAFEGTIVRSGIKRLKVLHSEMHSDLNFSIPSGANDFQNIMHLHHDNDRMLTTAAAVLQRKH